MKEKQDSNLALTWRNRGENNCMQLPLRFLLSSQSKRAERNRASIKCSTPLQGGSKHRLSDLGAGTKQSPASHQSWQGWMTVWPLLMGGGGGKRGEWRRKDAAKRPKGH